MVSAGFLHYEVAHFPQKFIRNFGEMLWEYINILFLIKVSPNGFSFHWSFLPGSVITEMVAKWWFSNSHSTFVSDSTPWKSLPFSPISLFMSACTHGFFFCSVGYISSLYLFWCWVSPRPSQWKPLQISGIILICLHHPLRSSSHSDIVICFRLTPWP